MWDKLVRQDNTFMKIILETQRLQLREFEAADAESLYQLNAIPEVIQYTGDAPFENVAEALDFVNNYDAYQRLGFGRWAIILKENNDFIGWSGLGQSPNNPVDIGFRIFPKYWGQGYAPEAAKACLRYGFEQLGLETIIGRVLAENTASIRVLEKIGMQYWKKGACGDWENALYYRLPSE